MAQRFNALAIVVIYWLAASGNYAVWGQQPANEQRKQSAVERLVEQATDLQPLMSTSLGTSFLAAVDQLPPIESSRVVYWDENRRQALTASRAAALDAEQLAGYERRSLDGHFYYFTKYGSPLAFARPLDLVAAAGLQDIRGARIVEFGFGSIGQLRLLASLGADVVGIEVDPLLEALYDDPQDAGRIPLSSIIAGNNSASNGHLRLLFGRFPAEGKIVQQMGTEYNLFISKNTLKRGYVHPERDVDPARTLQLGVDDDTFVRRVHQLLKTGGMFMIYNLHPAHAAPDEPYIPWADGRSPFAKALYEKIGFQVIAYDVDDTEMARRLGKALGWDAQMDLDNNLFATYTLLRK